MTDHPLEHLADDLAQELFNYDRRCQGKQPYPLTATSTLHRDEYAADARRIMAVIGPLLAEARAYDWPCSHHLWDDPTGPLCVLSGPHDGHQFEGTSVPQANDTEARQEQQR